MHLLRHLSIDLLALLVLLVQVLHPWVHPWEIIETHAADALVCPVSHVVGDVQVEVPWLAVLVAIVRDIRASWPWIGHNTLLHPLAPRPPPAMPL